MRSRLLHGLDQLVDNMLRGWHIRIAHAKINNIRAIRPRRRFQAIDLLEHVRGKSFDFMKFALHFVPAFSVC